MLTVTWTGVAGLAIRTSDKVILVDPYVSRHSKREVVLSRLSPKEERVRAFLRGFDRVDHILVGHSHYDHVLDVPLIAKLTGAKVVGSESTANLLRACGIPESQIAVARGKDHLDLGGVSVEIAEAIHGRSLLGVPFPCEIAPGIGLPARSSKLKHGRVLQFVIHAEGCRIFQSGSAAFVEPNVRGLEADVAFVSLPWWRSCERFIPGLLGTLKPKLVVPIHYDDMFSSAPTGLKSLPWSDTVEFAQEVFRFDRMMEVRFMPVGGRLTLVS